MEFIIDRFEEELAVLEDENGNFTEISKALLPQNAKEGDCVVFAKGTYTLNTEKTADLKAEIDNLMDDLFV